MDEIKPEAVSPTGAALLKLPAWALGPLMMLVAVAMYIAMTPEDFEGPVRKYAKLIAAVGAALGLGSAGLRKAAPVLLLVFTIGLSSCSSVTPFVVSGQSLAALDNQFADTGAAMNAGLDAGKMKPDAYRKWGVFALKYKAVEQMAYDAWRSAVAANDKALAGKFGEALGLLSAELLTFYGQAKDAHLLPAGAP